MTEALVAALQAHEAGLCVVPPREDGSKAPITQWKRYQSKRPTEELLRGWYELEGRRGVGLVCGAISGNLEMLEFEGQAVRDGLHTRFRELAERSGAGQLLDRVLRGYTERTPSGGFHVFYRCAEAVQRNLKLARRPATPVELAVRPENKLHVLIETRGEGGYVITAPSNGGVHPTGQAWVLVQGGFEQIATISHEERDCLLDLARSFDQMPKQDEPRTLSANHDGLRPGDDFNQRASWQQLLQSHGWTYLFSAADGNQHWRRPGKRIGTSATVSQNGNGVLYIFSANTPFAEERGYSKFSAYAVLAHDGDFSAAARALAEQGYGSEAAVEPAAASEPTHEAATPVASVQARQGWPSPPDKEVYHGLAGNIVELIQPYVESDPVAILVQFLCAFGVAVGIGPQFLVGATRHGPNTFVALVGQTSRARKGTSWDPLEILFRRADPWFAQRVMSGIGSGERLVGLVQDGADGDAQSDRRLLLQEPELARLLAVVNREGSTLSAYLRAAYDGKPLRNEVKKESTVASTHHIGLIGHCTEEELQNRLSEEQIRNGLANRILWFCVKRVGLLPEPAVFEGEVVQEAASALEAVLHRAANVHRMRRSQRATNLWAEWYLELQDEDLGLVGAITARAEAHVIRLACIYALCDAAEIVEVVHMRAAIALVEYSKRCVMYLWGRQTGDVIADKILDELALGPLWRTQVGREVFSGNVPGYQLEKAARMLERRGLLVREKVATGLPGRPGERWRLP